jgi:iron(III) transport system substrate-binding protein
MQADRKYRIAQGLRRLALLGALGLSCLSALPVLAQTQAQPPSPRQPLEKTRLSDIYMYQGADREQRLVDEAQKEGTVVLYTSINSKDAIPITAAFEKKYKIKVALWKASSEKVLQRTVTEARAGHFTPDVIDTNGPEMEALYREKILAEFYSPVFRDIPTAAFPAHRQYVADRLNFFTLAYNTKLVKPEEVPKTYDDLLSPRWVGKIGIETGDVDWFAAMVKYMGEEQGLAYFRKLAESRPQLQTGHTLMVELLAAGQLQILISAYNHNVARENEKGAPVAWKALTPTFGRPNGIGLSRNAPHPYAGLLFAEFMLSREGQELIKSRHRIPSSRAVDSPLNKFQYELIDPSIVLDEADKWQKIWSQIFLQAK